MKKDTRRGNELDLGDPEQMVGMSILSGGSGGICSGCGQPRSVLYADGKCAKCSSANPAVTGIPQHPSRRRNY